MANPNYDEEYKAFLKCKDKYSEGGRLVANIDGYYFYTYTLGDTFFEKQGSSYGHIPLTNARIGKLTRLYNSLRSQYE